MSCRALGPLWRGGTRTLPWSLALAGAWSLVLAVTAVGLPVRFDLEPDEQVMDTLAGVVLVIPSAVASLGLYEGPEHLVISTARSLRAPRLWRAGALLLAAMLGAIVVATLSPVPPVTFIGAALLMGALGVLGASLVGLEGGSLLSLVVMLVCLAPGLVPFEHNLIFNPEARGELWACVILLWFAALASYVRHGSAGWLSLHRSGWAARF